MMNPQDNSRSCQNCGHRGMCGTKEKLDRFLMEEGPRFASCEGFNLMIRDINGWPGSAGSLFLKRHLMQKQKRPQSNKKQEFHIHFQICEWLRLEHPNVIFRSDLGGVRLTLGQAVQVKKLQKGRAFPDLFICEPRGQYHGLFVEIKISSDSVFTKAGKLRENQHITEQFDMLVRLRQRGYGAEFGCGFDSSCNIIRDYLADQNEQAAL